MKIKKGPLLLFTETGYWVTGLYSRRNDDRYWDVYLQRDTHYFVVGATGRLAGDFRLTRQGEPWQMPHFQRMADEERERARLKFGRWHINWRSHREILEIERENRERESIRTKRT